VTLTLPASAPALLRREQLLKAWPDLRISAGTGYWQAEMDEPRGQTVITRFELGELLDRVEFVLTHPDGLAGARRRCLPDAPAGTDGRPVIPLAIGHGCGLRDSGRRRAGRGTWRRPRSPRTPSPGTARPGKTSTDERTATVCGENKDGSKIDCGQCDCPTSATLHQPIGMLCGVCGRKVA
jgi:hypothetical protein